MTNSGEEAKKQPEKAGKTQLESKSVFVSHSHADRKLADAMKDLIEGAFSGLVSPFVSSDPGPTGGLMPGDEWFARIGTALSEAEGVWVLATPTAIRRPWIYWEAGIGRALCPNGVVVLRVGLGASEIPSPLNAYQSYDCLDKGQVGSLVGKVATQVGMTLRSVLVEDCVTSWLGKASNYTPEVQEGSEEPQVIPERLDRLDAAISRLETLASGSSAQAAPRESTDELRRRIAEDADRTRSSLLGDRRILHARLNEFIRALEAAPEDASFTLKKNDNDGDAQIRVESIRKGQSAYVYLDGSAFDDLKDASSRSERVLQVLEDIRRETA